MYINAPRERRGSALLDVLAAVLRVGDFQAIAEGGKLLHQDSLLNLSQGRGRVFKQITSFDSSYSTMFRSMFV